ncbi:hypothetical protein GCM10018781_25210 [Kitasatospora indigofera]|uniref:Uncharacterized protein n=1 Tax=Kitasatospora indigofera TaxID=67307 RepID=A0A919FMH1_9ACTN|nr:hypothetical protein GCM10018781_25210 [Kitasatospora indigofera]
MIRGRSGCRGEPGRNRTGGGRVEPPTAETASTGAAAQAGAPNQDGDTCHDQWGQWGQWGN